MSEKHRLENILKEMFSKYSDKDGYDVEMSEDEIRNTDEYKYAYNILESWDWSYTDGSMNYYVLGCTFDHLDMESDIHEFTMIPKFIIGQAITDFAENNPNIVELADKYVENDFEPLEEDEDE